ncbi:OmpH family outer membrane protein [Parabacteroides chinchillae]|uniref:Periplasmic chaperone for outer membrane proteins Skp n=1 Tax=Parabacteroides chinchillae TaxID=871327 RepID=A0A8G2BUL8_9BACT|nr:OmpH family outer membrane protein [Parabacteroides chinchillae]SEF58756.1 periplasmic chaperone for outer membrane proteins Skp [Parabacteroides chinchillae]
MKKLIVLLFMILPLGAIAQEVKIAYVNTQDIFLALPDAGDMEKKMADLNEKYKGELKTMQDEYTKKYSDFVAQQDSLTENIKLRRMQEIEDIRGRIDNFMQVAQQDIQKKQGELLQPIQDKIQKAIKAVGDEKGYTYIVDPQVLLYTGTNAIDATSFVKSKLGI